jgi:DNA repair protein RecO (recombination protein O)
VANYKTEGIVLKSIKLGEADKIITIYSSERGKISAVAKGIRKTKSKFGARLEPFSHVNLMLYDGRNLDIVTQVELISSFREIREDFDKVVYGAAMLDLLEKISPLEEKDEIVFDFMLSSLRALSIAPKNVPLLLAAFDLKMMSIAGFRPNLTNCAVCSEEAAGFKKEIVFSCEWGGLLCEKCGLSDIEAISISRTTLEAINEIMRREMEDVASLEVSERLERELLMLSQRHVKYYLQARLKSREYLARSEVAEAGLNQARQVVQDLRQPPSMV